MRILYISYDGMTDPLGQSQVLPYLIGLSGLGHEISIVSAEKKKHFDLNKKQISELTKSNGIDWHHVAYTSKPPVISTLYDLRKMKALCRKLHKKKSFDIVHCRSYLPSLIGLHFKKKFGLPFVFDMRGFWADERIEGGIWRIKNPVFRIIYNYFKQKEKDFINHAAHIVCLTQEGKNIVENWQKNLKSSTPISVIPCCVDTDFFSAAKVDKEEVAAYKSLLKIEDNDKILLYLGSIGTWYMADEMMAFFKVLSSLDSNFKFLFITYEPEPFFKNLAQKHQVDTDKIRVYKANRSELPSLLSLSCVSIFFIKPVFSKKASSPTKQGELMSMGIPVLCNSGIGDTTEIIKQSKGGYIIESFNRAAYQAAAENIGEIMDLPKQPIRDAACNYFSLGNGVAAYNDIYKRLKKS